MKQRGEKYGIQSEKGGNINNIGRKKGRKEQDKDKKDRREKIKRQSREQKKMRLKRKRQMAVQKKDIMT